MGPAQFKNVFIYLQINIYYCLLLLLLLQINGEDVVSATHEHCVKLMMNSGNRLELKVATSSDSFGSAVGSSTPPLNSAGTVSFGIVAL